MLPIRWMKNILSAVVFISVVVISIKAAFGQSTKSVEDFYRGKQVRFITGYSAGGLLIRPRGFSRAMWGS